MKAQTLITKYRSGLFPIGTQLERLENDTEKAKVERWIEGQKKKAKKKSVDPEPKTKSQATREKWDRDMAQVGKLIRLGSPEKQEAETRTEGEVSQREEQERKREEFNRAMAQMGELAKKQVEQSEISIADVLNQVEHLLKQAAPGLTARGYADLVFNHLKDSPDIQRERRRLRNK